MKKVVFILIVLVIALPTNAADLSAIVWQTWPSRAFRPAQPAGAVKVTAPAGSLQWVQRWSTGIVYGTNSRPMPVWATVSQTNEAKVYNIHRLGVCGNPAGGSWVVGKPVPPPAPESRAGQPAQQIVVQVSCPEPAPQIVMPVPLGGRQRGPGYSVRHATKSVVARDVLGAFTYKTSTTVCEQPKTCPPGVPVPPGVTPTPGHNYIPVPPAPNSGQVNN